MMVVQEDILSWKDSMGRTVLTWIAHDMPEELEAAIESCLSFDLKDNRYRLRRHPGIWEKTSRDHWSYFIIFRKLKYEDWEFKKFVKKIPSMRGMNLWVKSLAGNKSAERWYYRWAIPEAWLTNRWNKFVRVIGFIYPERSNYWWIDQYDEKRNNGQVLQDSVTEWQKWWARKLIPLYPVHVKGWQLFVMPDNPRKEILKRIIQKRIGEHNYMLRLLMGDTEISQEEIDTYPNMSGYRPGVPLNEPCDRDIYELPDQDNLYEKVLLTWLFKKLKENAWPQK
jgi:hypothetical protein